MANWRQRRPTVEEVKAHRWWWLRLKKPDSPYPVARELYVRDGVVFTNIERSDDVPIDVLPDGADEWALCPYPEELEEN